MSSPSPVRRRDDRGLRSAVAVVATVGMVGAGFFYVASGLLAPGWAIIALWVVWLVLAGIGVLLARARSYLVIGVPVLAVAIWFLVLTLGEQVLGWRG